MVGILDRLFGRKKRREYGVTPLAPHNTFGVFSPKGGVGKTTVLLEMGTLLALKDLKVLFIDWDLWSHRMTLRIAGEARYGKALLDYLVGKAKETDIILKLEYESVHGKMASVYLVPAVNPDAPDLEENIKKLADLTENKPEKVKERATALTRRLGRSFDIIFNDYPVPGGVIPPAYYRAAVAASYNLIVVIDPVKSTIDNAIRYVNMFFSKHHIFMLVVNMIRPYKLEYMQAYAESEDMCKLFGPDYVVYVPFDPRLFDVRVGSAAKPAALQFSPVEIPALRVLNQAADAMVKRLGNPEEITECIVIHLKV